MHTPPSLRTLIHTRAAEWVAAARRIRDPAPGPNNYRANGDFNTVVGRGGGSGTPGQHWTPSGGSP